MADVGDGDRDDEAAGVLRIAVAHSVRSEEVRIRSALRLGHRVRREDLLVEQGHEPPLLLLLGAVGREHLHVPGVGRRRPEDLRRRGVAPEDLVQQAKLQLPVARSAELLVEEQRPQALSLDLVLERLDERPDLGILRAHRVREHVLERLHLLPTEILDPVELLLEFRISGEVPSHPPKLLRSPWPSGSRPCRRASVRRCRRR